MGREVTSIDDDLPEPEEPESVVSDAPDKVRSLLARLPDNYRRILELRFLQAFSVREAAESDGGERREREGVAVPCAAHGGANDRGGDCERTNRAPLRRGPAAGAAHGTRTPRRFRSARDEDRHRVAGRPAGSDSPREEFVTDLHRRLAESVGDPARRLVPVVPERYPQAGRHRHRTRRGVRGGRNGGRPHPACRE